MNDWSATHYCSGDESGWTMYLDQSYTSEPRFGGGGGGGIGENYGEKEAKGRAEEVEEDLSMVSDASSGPPQCLENNQECFYNKGYSSYAFLASESAMNCKEEKKKKKKIGNGKSNGRNQQHSYLDDTASSPVFGHGKKINEASNKQGQEENAVDFSQGFSATHSKRKSALRKHFGFFGSQKSAPEE